MTSTTGTNRNEIMLMQEKTTIGSVTLAELIKKKKIYVCVKVRKRRQKIRNWEK